MSPLAPIRAFFTAEDVGVTGRRGSLSFHHLAKPSSALTPSWIALSSGMFGFPTNCISASLCSSGVCRKNDCKLSGVRTRPALFWSAPGIYTTPASKSRGFDTASDAAIADSSELTSASLGSRFSFRLGVAVSKNLGPVAALGALPAIADGPNELAPAPRIIDRKSVRLTAPAISNLRALRC